MERNTLVITGHMKIVSLILTGLLLLILLPFTGGCGGVKSHRRVTETLHIELKPGDYEFARRVEGKDSVGRYFFFFKFFTPNPVDAVSQAMQQAPEANWLTNRHISLIEEVYVPLIYHRQTLYVEGEAVKVHSLGEVEP